MKVKIRGVFLRLMALGTCALLLLNSHAQDLENVAKAKPFEIHGAVSAGVGYYASKGFNNTRKPYSYFVSAAPVFSVYGIQIPINFTLTEGSKSISNPFAQFGINPYWKWIKLYGGWTNMRWSPTTLNGKTFLGVGIDINPSYFRFGAMYGRFNPVIKENLLGPNPQQPQYKRRGFGFKIGVGKEDNYFDFILIKGKDVANSLATVTDVLTYAPAENAVFGIVSHQAFLKKTLTWDLDASISAYTRNTESQLLDIGTGTGTKFLKLLIPPRLSTSYAWAAHTNVSYRSEKFSLTFDYNRIQPEFQSMGVDYIMNDQEKITLTQGFPAAKKKVNVVLNEFFQRDDLAGRKAAKTNRAGLMGSVNWNASQKFGMATSYNGYFVFQTKGLKQLNDTIKLMQLQQTFLLAPYITLLREKSIHNIIFNITYTRLDDLNDFTARYSRNSTVNTNVGYTVAFSQLGFSFSPSFNVLYSKGVTFNLLNVGPVFAFSKGFWKSKINTSLSIGYTASRVTDVWTSHTINNNISIGVRFDNHHSLKYTNSILYTKYKVSNTSEYKGELSYTYVFDYAVEGKRKKKVP